MAEADDRTDTALRAARAKGHAGRHEAGLAALRAGRVEEAIAEFGAAAALAPSIAAYHVNLGSALQRAGRLAEAIRAFDRSVALLPDLPAAHHNRGNALLAARRADEAVEAQARAAALAPGEARFQYAWALALDRAHRLPEAEARFRAALALDPDHAGARVALGLLRLADGDVAAALEYLREQHRRARTLGRPHDDAARMANRGKVRHDLEQLRWLAGEGLLADDGLIAAYGRLLAGMPDGS
ncbi:MAG: tetratricopeptide repeat protein, partial [Alphaproteobacteria bacterium]